MARVDARVSPALRRLAISLALACVAATTTGCAAVYHLTGLDCTMDPTTVITDEAKADQILAAIPPDATPGGDVYVSPGCMDDNFINEVGRRFHFTTTPDAIVAFYEKAAPADGWRMTKDGTKTPNARPGSAVSRPSHTCYSKQLGGYTVDLELSFDFWSDDVTKNSSLQTYWLEISFAPEGGNCHLPPSPYTRG
jgi:hypothetical protein